MALSPRSNLQTKRTSAATLCLALPPRTIETGLGFSSPPSLPLCLSEQLPHLVPITIACWNSFWQALTRCTSIHHSSGALPGVTPSVPATRADRPTQRRACGEDQSGSWREAAPLIDDDKDERMPAWREAAEGRVLTLADADRLEGADGLRSAELATRAKLETEEVSRALRTAGMLEETTLRAHMVALGSFVATSSLKPGVRAWPGVG